MDNQPFTTPTEPPDNSGSSFGENTQSQSISQNPTQSQPVGEPQPVVSQPGGNHRDGVNTPPSVDSSSGFAEPVSNVVVGGPGSAPSVTGPVVTAQSQTTNPSNLSSTVVTSSGPRKRSRILVSFGIVCLVLLVAGALFLTVFNKQASALSTANKFIQAVEDGDLTTLKKISPYFASNAQPGTIGKKQNLFNINYTTVPKEYYMTSGTSNNQSRAIVYYSAPSTVTKQTGYVLLFLQKNKGQWQVVGVNLDNTGKPSHKFSDYDSSNYSSSGSSGPAPNQSSTNTTPVGSSEGPAPNDNATINSNNQNTLFELSSYLNLFYNNHGYYPLAQPNPSASKNSLSVDVADDSWIAKIGDTSSITNSGLPTVQELVFDANHKHINTSGSAFTYKPLPDGCALLSCKQYILTTTQIGASDYTINSSN